MKRKGGIHAKPKSAPTPCPQKEKKENQSKKKANYGDAEEEKKISQKFSIICHYRRFGSFLMENDPTYTSNGEST